MTKEDSCDKRDDCLENVLRGSIYDARAGKAEQASVALNRSDIWLCRGKNERERSG